MENPPWFANPTEPNSGHTRSRTATSTATATKSSTKKQPDRADAQLVFVNYTNPEEELRDRDKKRLVAKWSVVNTQPRHAARLRTAGDPGHVPNTASYDPFASLPFTLGRREWKLLQFWLDGASFGVIPSNVKSQLSELRKTVSLPERLKSKPGMAANFALIETMLPTTPQNLRVAVAPHLTTAISALNQSLSEMQTGPPVSVLHCISVLMTVSLRTGDLASLRTHIFGMALVISRHPTFLMGSSDCVHMAICWAFAYTKTAILPERPALLEFDVQQCSVPLKHPAGQGFEQLQKKNLISTKIAKYILPLLALRPLSEMVREYRATADEAEELLRCAWASMLALKNSNGTSRNPFERAIRCCLIMHVAQELMENPDRPLRYWSLQFFEHFCKIDLYWLIEYAPEVLMWMMLLNAPYVKGTLRAWSLRLVNRLQRQTRSFPFNYALARKTCEQFLWSRKQDGIAEVFCEDAAETTRGAIEIPQFMPTDPTPLAAGSKKDRKPMHCAFCGRSNCTSIFGGIWAGSGTDFYRMCDFEWIETEDVDDIEMLQEASSPEDADLEMKIPVR